MLGGQEGSPFQGRAAGLEDLAVLLHPVPEVLDAGEVRVTFVVAGIRGIAHEGKEVRKPAYLEEDTFEHTDAPGLIMIRCSHLQVSLAQALQHFVHEPGGDGRLQLTRARHTDQTVP